MIKNPIPLRHGPPEVRHRIFGERSDDLPVGSIEVLMHRRVRLSQWALRQASDSYWRLYWPQSRGASIDYQGQCTALMPGRLYLIPPLTPFDSDTAAPFTKWYFHFTLRGSEMAPAAGVFELIPTPRMKTLLATICPRTFAGNAPSDGIHPWRVIELLALVIMHAPESLWCAAHTDARLAKAITLINHNFSKKLTLEQLGKEAGLSPRTLGKLFVERTGFTPIRYLTELRLNHGCRLLRHSQLTIEEIAEHCGFANRFYLTRMLRKYRHTTPAVFRRQAAAKVAAP